MSDLHRFCTGCKETKTNTEFGAKYGHCKLCAKKWHANYYKNPEVKARHKEQGKLYRKLNPEKDRQYILKSRLKTKYNMTVEEYENKVAIQNGRCAICKSMTSKRKRSLGLFVDHDHSCCPGERSCGKCIRGLLCHRCNLAAGWTEDSLDIVEALKAYIIQYL